MARKSASSVVVESVARVLLPRGFEHKGRTFLRRENPAFAIVEVQVDRLRGMKLVLRWVSEVNSRNRGWPIADPFREGVVDGESGPFFIDGAPFREWERIPDLSSAELLGQHWAQWLEARGLEFLRTMVDEILERDRS